MERLLACDPPELRGGAFTNTAKNGGALTRCGCAKKPHSLMRSQSGEREKFELKAPRRMTVAALANVLWSDNKSFKTRPTREFVKIPSLFVASKF